jgi:hypothetical protein
MSDSAERIRQGALSAYDEVNPQFRDEALFSAIASSLVESGNALLPEFAPLTIAAGRRAIRVHGYEYDEEQEVLTLISMLDCHRDNDLLQVWDDRSCGSAEITRAISDLEAIIAAAKEARLPKLDESDPANRLEHYLQRVSTQAASHLSLAVWTTGLLTKDAWKKTARSTYHTIVWDAAQLASAVGAGTQALEIDFSPYGGVSFLMDDQDFENSSARGGSVLVGKVKGDCLADLYFEHRTRLLQQNVRAFLSFTGSVNKGILETAKTAPDRFLAYNNGIAATASGVALEKRAPGVYAMTRASDFQIVNGGQTTATLMIARNDKDVDLSAIQVAMKLTVVSPEDLDELVPKISRFANSQNKIQDSDFESNNPWLVKLEQISRRIEAPKDSKSEGQRIRWYFERVRGQYNVDLGRAGTAAQRKAFKALHPPRTKFSKTDLAVAGMAWDQEPYVASLGPQKCFAAFAKRLYSARQMQGEGRVCEPSDEDFRRLCCVMIMRREAMSLCRELSISPLLSNASVSAYAIARIAHDTKARLPWADIWQHQQLPDRVYKAIRLAILGCDKAIVGAAEERDKLPSEFAKKPECWSVVIAATMELGLSTTGSGWDGFSLLDTVRTAEMVEAAGVFFRLDSSDWDAISRALERLTKNQAYIGCATTMAQYTRIQKKPTEKQARVLAKGLMLVRKNGLCASVLTKLPVESWATLEQLTE